MTRVVLFGKAHQRRQRWTNDGGWTTVLAEHLDESSNAAMPLWRLSIAEIDADGPFSILPGIARELVLLDGNGLELRDADAAGMRIDLRLASLRFYGDAALHCRLIGGPVRVFNVMTRQRRVSAKVMARPLQGTMVLFGDAGDSWLIHPVAGDVSLGLDVGTHLAGAGEVLQVDRVPARTRMTLQGSGEVILVRMQAAATA